MEGVQRRATKMVKKIFKINYVDMQRFLKFNSLDDRTIWGGLILVFKIVRSFEEVQFIRSWIPNYFASLLGETKTIFLLNRKARPWYFCQNKLRSHHKSTNSRAGWIRTWGWSEVKSFLNLKGCSDYHGLWTRGTISLGERRFLK